MTDDEEMTAADQTASATATIISASLPPQPVTLTAAEITGLIGVFQQMLRDAIKPVLDKLDDNAKGATARWQRHDDEAAAKEARSDARFIRIEQALDSHIQIANAHFAKEHDEEVRLDARIRPIRGSIAWLWQQRRDIVIVLIGLGVFASFVAEAVARAVNPI